MQSTVFFIDKKCLTHPVITVCFQLYVFKTDPLEGVRDALALFPSPVGSVTIHCLTIFMFHFCKYLFPLIINRK